MKHFFTAILFFSFFAFNNNVQACDASNVQISVSGNGNCEGGQITIIVFVDSPNGPEGTFHWSRNNGTLPAGFPSSTTDPFVVISSFFAEYNGTYSVTYVDQNGCSSSTNALIEVSPNPDPFIEIITHCYGTELIASDLLNTAGPHSYSWLESGAQTSSIIYSGPGGPASNQTVTITNASGCSAQTNTGLLSQVALQANITGGAKIIGGRSIKLKANANYKIRNYIWYKNNVKVLSGYNQNILTVTDSAMYRVRLATTEGCILNIYRRVTCVPSIRMEDSQNTIYEGQLSIYPNPANNEINITGLEPGEHFIYDITGRARKTFISNEINLVLDISGLSEGIYLLKSGDQTIRFIKQ